MTREEIYLRTIEALFEQYPVKHRNEKGRYKRSGATVTRQHRNREAALNEMHGIIRLVNSHQAYVTARYKTSLDIIKRSLVKGGIPKAVVTGVFTLLD